MERQELHCHNCNKYVQFSIDTEKDGQHILKCPNCGHEHYRVVKDGKITGERWGQDPSQNIPTYYVSTATVTYTSTTVYTSISTSGTTSASSFALDSWSSTGYTS